MPLINNPVDRQARLAYLDGQLKLTELYIQIHLAKIQSGFTVRRKVSDFHGHEITDDQKIDGAFSVIGNQVDRYEELLDFRDKLIRGEED